MSLGQFKLGNQSKRVLEKCKKKRSIDKVMIFDVDENKVNYVDADSMTFHFHRSRSVKSNEQSTSETIIKIDDDDDDDASFNFDSYKNAGTNTDCSYSFQADDCVILVDDSKIPFRVSKRKKLSPEKAFSKVNTSGNHGGERNLETHEISENVIDCEILDDSSGRIKEKWERTFSKKRSQVSNQIPQDNARTAGSNVDFGFHISNRHGSFCNTAQKSKVIDDKKGSSFFQTKQTEDDLLHRNKMAWKQNNIASHYSENGVKFKTSVSNIEIPSSYKSANNIFGSDAPVKHSMPTINVHVGEQLKSINGGEKISKDVCISSSESNAIEMHCDPSLNNTHSEIMTKNDGIAIFHKKTVLPSVCTFNGKQLPLLQKKNEELIEECLLERTADSLPDAQCSFFSDREKLKQTEEYKVADKEEWASRQEQLRIQSDEIQKLRRRKKAQTLLLLNMEKRQKERLEEVRESHKKEMEAINLKDKFRAEIRKKLERIELIHRSMPSLLRSLGIPIEGGVLPSSQEVNAAYKKALLRFHPDRSSRADLRQQVEAEEKFKLISRLKEKLLPR